MTIYEIVPLAPNSKFGKMKRPLLRYKDYSIYEFLCENTEFLGQTLLPLFYQTIIFAISIPQVLQKSASWTQCLAVCNQICLARGLLQLQKESVLHAVSQLWDKCARPLGGHGTLSISHVLFARFRWERKHFLKEMGNHIAKKITMNSLPPVVLIVRDPYST